MKNVLLKLLSSLTLFCFIGGCGAQPEVKSAIFIQIGNRKTKLSQVDSPSSLQKEILGHIKTNWNSRRGNASDWVKVYSIRTGGKNEANETLDLNINQPAEFASTRSTDLFRIHQKNDKLFILEEKKDNGFIESKGKSTSGDWNVIQAIVKPSINLNVLENILKN